MLPADKTGMLWNKLKTCLCHAHEIALLLCAFLLSGARKMQEALLTLVDKSAFEEKNVDLEIWMCHIFHMYITSHRHDFSG